MSHLIIGAPNYNLGTANFQGGGGDWCIITAGETSVGSTILLPHQRAHTILTYHI